MSSKMQQILAVRSGGMPAFDHIKHNFMYQKGADICLCLLAQAPGLDWQDVWEHALKDCQVAVVLRVALDDSSQMVMTAAAEALAELVALESIGPAHACPTSSGSKRQFLFVHYEGMTPKLSVESRTRLEQVPSEQYP